MARIKKSGKYRSRYEQRLADFLTANKVPFGYETHSFQYYRPRNGMAIVNDEEYYGTVYTAHTYTVDFVLKNGVFLEAKGRFTSGDRTKILRVLEQNPTLDLRMVLMRNQRLNKRSNTMYSEWCEKHGIPYVVSVDGEIPLEWAKDG